jgi:hypothetical protein
VCVSAVIVETCSTEVIDTIYEANNVYTQFWELRVVRGIICVGLISRPGESYLVCPLSVIAKPSNEGNDPEWGRIATEEREFVDKVTVTAVSVL